MNAQIYTSPQPNISIFNPYRLQNEHVSLTTRVQWSFDITQQLMCIKQSADDTKNYASFQWQFWRDDSLLFTNQDIVSI